MTEFKRDFAVLMAKFETAEEIKKFENNVDTKPNYKNKIVHKYGSMVDAVFGVILVNVAFIGINGLIRK